MSQKLKNQIVTVFASFVIFLSIWGAISAQPKGEIAPAAAHEFSIEEKLEQKNKELKISELASELKKQESITLTSLKRESEISEMIEKLNSGECSDIEKPENCIKTEVKEIESPKVTGVK